MLSRNKRFQRLVGGGLLERATLGFISRVQFFLLKQHKEPAALRLLRKVRRERTCLLTAYEEWTVYSVAQAYRKMPGDMAEVGVFQGVSAKLICEAKGERTLHLFDTFEGLPKSTEKDGGVHDEGQYAHSLASVRDYLEGYGNVHFYKGLFPESAGPIADKTFSFVHLDVDLYESTLEGLRFFYPRMLPGGVIVSHDYSILGGVKAAVNEFFEDKRENPIELPSTQCMIVKL
ncbi:MAG: TylF/MycF/NovP-related O-methyltransferase [Pirellulales bacterium]